jgi:hypothetical protein
MSLPRVLVGCFLLAPGAGISRDYCSLLPTTGKISQSRNGLKQSEIKVSLVHQQSITQI